MTELERHLSEALQSLSAQYEREQRTSAERIADLCGQVTSLLQQVEQLQQRVNELATDYAGLAADYRQIANELGRRSKR